LIDKAPAFDSQEHEKAWLIRVATNLCKNQLRSWWRRHEDLEDYKELIGTEDQEDQYTDLKYALMRLPDKYKTVVVLYYYEDYKSEEIANILGKPASTIRNYLCDARIILKKYLEESEDGK
jgi:RNA polymerase sigma-70 factor (ECF subfamily)